MMMANRFGKSLLAGSLQADSGSYEASAKAKN
jgi:hypothetical protein